MPTSWYQVISVILDQIQLYKPASILDIGIGFGKYGVLIRDMLEIPLERYHKNQWQVKIDGIEAFSDYRNPLHQYCYDQVYYDDVMNVIHNLPCYDIIMLIDVLEHFEKEEGFNLISSLLKYTAKCLIISTPLYPDVQKEYMGNRHEKHKSRWVITDFLEYDYSYKLVPIGNNAAQLITIFPKSNRQKIDLHADKILQINTHNKNKHHLTIGYILPHKKLTGGMKMLLEQMKHLRAREHHIIAIGKTGGENKILPDWYDITVDDEISIPRNESYLNHVNNCDVIIASWVSQIPELIGAKIPVVYWEQGHEWLFGDFDDLSENSPIRQHLIQCYSLPCFLIAVSPLIAKILKVRYNREAFVIPNGIDTDFYRPGHKPENGTILLVGNPFLRFKGFDIALKSLQKVWSYGRRFRVKWICQTEPKVRGINFPLDIIVKPSQVELAEHYRTTDIFLFTSWYEGFGMPPLEAMASGVPVVATQCGGIDSYAIPGENALFADPGDIDSLAAAIIYLLENKGARDILGKRGRETAMKFRFSEIVPLLENYLFSVVKTYNY
ncbi:glycosyltransferase family 4 protein [Moorella sp. Hama-1]|uniref:glycosyltransferase family 4 protein n=1 Tax=Moorella sp. Hama-1 TaxID=2138101 RepID=UPI000D65DC39|nr:glycosyltransferase family 4 protein [Moorella sp. Hama-1]BCV20785.1 hypothetical protein hamaS1_08540 [Moorella sp. Hama-1]